MVQAEQGISEVEDVSHTLRKEVTSLTTSLKDIAWKEDDAETRVRRNNLHFIGFLEGIEGSDVGVFLDKWLRDSLLTAQFSSCFVIERAHRMPSFRPPVEHLHGL